MDGTSNKPKIRVTGKDSIPETATFTGSAFEPGSTTAMTSQLLAPYIVRIKLIKAHPLNAHFSESLTQH